MPGVFISYRKSDSAGFTGRLFDHLSRRFGPDEVFMDVEGGIEHGADFPQAIESAVSQAGAMLVVIGPEWLECTDARGNRRLDDPADWVRLEVATALRREILVLPVLVDGATMPAAEQLPPDLQRLARKQAIEISNSRWEYDLGRLIARLERVARPGGRTRRVRAARTAAGVATVLVLGAAGVWSLTRRPDARAGSSVPSDTAGVVADTLGRLISPVTPVVPPAADTGNRPAAPAHDPADLTGDWRDEDGNLYRVARRDGGGFEMGGIDPPDTTGVYRNITVDGRSVEISIGALPSATQYEVANLRLDVGGNVMSGLRKSTQIEDVLPVNWVLHRVQGRPGS